MKGFTTFIFSFVPGAGQMNLGYMKRGLSIMTIAGILVWLALTVGFTFIIPLLIVMAYSFFDTYNTRERLKTNGNIVTDDMFIWDSEDLFSSKLNLKFKNKSIGWILLIFGSWCLFEKIMGSVVRMLDCDVLRDMYYMISRQGPSLIIAGFAIYFGLKMIKE